MKQYEYKSINHSSLIKIGSSFTLQVDKLNELGKEGWELVTIDKGSVIFKREVIPTEESSAAVVAIYEEALKEIADACNPSLKASSPRIAREALLKANAEW